MNKQQTPKPEAQLPEAVPPLSLHSEAVQQTPTVAFSFWVVHASLSNWTTEKRDRPLGLIVSMVAVLATPTTRHITRIDDLILIDPRKLY